MPSQWWTYESEDTIRKRKAAQFERDAKAQRGPNPPTPPPPTPKGPATGPGAASNFERYAKDALLGVQQAAGGVADTLSQRATPRPNFQTVMTPTEPKQRSFVPPFEPGREPRLPAQEIPLAPPEQREEVWQDVDPLSEEGLGRRLADRALRAYGPAIAAGQELRRGLEGKPLQYSPEQRGELLSQTALIAAFADTPSTTGQTPRVPKVPGGKPAPKGEAITPSEAAPVPPTGPEAAAAFNQQAEQQLAEMRQGAAERQKQPWEMTRESTRNDYGWERTDTPEPRKELTGTTISGSPVVAGGTVRLRDLDVSTMLPRYQEAKIVSVTRDPVSELMEAIVQRPNDTPVGYLADDNGVFSAFRDPVPSRPADIMPGSGSEDAWRIGYADALDGLDPNRRPLPGGAYSSYMRGHKAAREAIEPTRAQPSESVAIPSESGAQPSELTREVPDTDLTPPAASTGELPAADAGPSPASAMQAAPDEAPKVVPAPPVSAEPAPLRTEAAAELIVNTLRQSERSLTWSQLGDAMRAVDPDAASLAPIEMQRLLDEGTVVRTGEPGYGAVYQLADQPNTPRTEAATAEAPTRTLPPFQDNELKPLSKYTDTLYREIGGEDAGIYIPTDATRLDLAREEVYLSNSPDLALGQGENKGILLEFDAGNIQGQISGAKPTWRMLWEQGEGEFIGRYNQQKVYRDALRAVTVKPDAQMPKPAKARLKMALSALEQQGWTKTANPDGSVTYRRPAAGEGVPPVAARPEPATFIEPAPVAAAEPATPTVTAVDETPVTAATTPAATAVAPEAPTPAQPGAPTPPVPPRPTTTGGPGATPPTGPRERAGNILLEKHPEDIRDVLAYTHDEQPVAMEEARRGVRPDALVKADAEALEGMVGSKMKSWKAGDIWNAETILAARLALEKAQRETLQLQRAVVGGDNSTEALVRFRLALERASDMQLAVQGVTAELGRGLRQFRQAIPGTLDADALERALADPAAPIAGGKGPRPVRDPSSSEVLGRVLEQLGGREWTEKLVKELGQLDVDNPIAVANFIRNLHKPGLWDYVMEMRYNNMLSGMPTQVVNSISNAATAMSAPIERGLAATVEVPLALAQRRPRQRFFHEVPVEAVGLVRGIPEGVRRALFIIRHGYGYEDLTRTELSHGEAFKGGLGHIINLQGSRWMRAADALFRSINYSGAYNAEAYRLARREGLKGQALAERMADLLTNPTPELMQRSADTAAYRVYQQKGGVATQALMDARNKAKLAGVPVGKLAIPFVQTPVNLLKYGLERSPLGILNPDLTRAVRRGDPAASDMLGRWVAGMAIAAPLAIYAWQGKITGRAPTDRNERDRFYREGKQPYSLKIGDQWRSYQRLEPFNQTFTQVAALVNAFEKTGEAPTTLVADVGLTIARNLFSQSYMEGLGDFLDAVEDPGRYGGRYLERFATSFLPASSGLRTVTRITDPVIREPKGLEEALEANIPGLSENVPAKLNVFGQEAKRETPWWSPYAVSTAKSNRVDTELARLGIEVGGVTDTIGKVKLNREQGVAYRQQAGQMTETGLKVLVLSKYYQEADDEAKARAIRYVTAKTHDLARENVAATLPGGERAGQKQRFTAAELRLRSLDYLSAWLQYQNIPKYDGMDAKEAEVADQHARKVRALARERNVPEKAALAYYSRIDPEGTELAYRVMRQGTNPQRTAFRKAHPELTGYIDEDLAERAAAMPAVPSPEVLQQIAAGVR